MHQKGSAWQRACSGGQSIDSVNWFRFPHQPGDLRFLARLMQFPRVCVALRGLKALVAQEVLDLVERHPLLDKPRSTRVTHGVRRVVRNEQLLPVRVIEGGTADGRPPGMTPPVAAIETTPSTSFGHSGEDQITRGQQVNMALERLQTVRRERNLPTAPATLRVRRSWC